MPSRHFFESLIFTSFVCGIYFADKERWTIPYVIPCLFFFACAYPFIAAKAFPKSVPSGEAAPRKSRAQDPDQLSP